MKDPEAYLLSLVGQKVQVWCSRFIYTGVLVGLDKEKFLLENCGIIFRTGPLTQKEPDRYEPFCQNPRIVFRAACEHIGVVS